MIRKLWPDLVLVQVWPLKCWVWSYYPSWKSAYLSLFWWFHNVCGYLNRAGSFVKVITSLDNNVQNVFGHICNRLTANLAPLLAPSEPFFVLDLSLVLSLSIYHWVFVSFWQLNFCCVAFRTLCPGTRVDKAQQGCPVSSPSKTSPSRSEEELQLDVYCVHYIYRLPLLG